MECTLEDSLTDYVMYCYHNTEIRAWTQTCMQTQVVNSNSCCCLTNGQLGVEGPVQPTCWQKATYQH